MGGGRLTDMENCAVGTLCGTADVLLLQPTNYWKNAQQNGMPFTLNPAILYRGVVANVLNNGFCVMSQFYINGVLKKVLLGDEQRELLLLPPSERPGRLGWSGPCRPWRSGSGVTRC